MIGVVCRFLYDYHKALLAICAHTYLLLCIGCHLGWGSVTIDPVPLLGPCKNLAHERHNFSSAMI